MYILHYRRRRSRSIFIVAVLLIGLGTGAYYSRGLLSSDTYIGPAPAAVYTTVTDNTPKVKAFDEPAYSFELPQDWEKYLDANAIAGMQTWRNTKENKGVRTMAVYLDSDTSKMAVNRVLPVSISGDHMIIEGSVSDNCLNFTGKRVEGQEHIPGKWQGVDFMCDADNRFRNVVGMSAAGAPTGVVLTSPKRGKHTVFITYTDSSSNFNPNYFSDMVKSFRLK